MPHLARGIGPDYEATTITPAQIAFSECTTVHRMSYFSSKLVRNYSVRRDEYGDVRIFSCVTRKRRKPSRCSRHDERSNMSLLFIFGDERQQVTHHMHCPCKASNKYRTCVKNLSRHGLLAKEACLRFSRRDRVKYAGSWVDERSDNETGQAAGLHASMLKER